MAQQVSKPAIMSKTLHFLLAAGITIGSAILQELIKPVPDWTQVVTLAAGVLFGVGGGYGRVVAQGPVTSIIGPSVTDK